jgi:hypothetical protein
MIASMAVVGPNGDWIFFVKKGRTLTSGRCVGVKVRGTVFTQRVIYIYIYIEREREREMNVVLAAW